MDILAKFGMQFRMRDCTRKPLGQTDGPKDNGGNTVVTDKKHRR
jgi:hypothetical protein